MERVDPKGESHNRAPKARDVLWHEEETAFVSFRPHTPGGPPKTVVGVGLLTPGMSAMGGFPTSAAFPLREGAVA